VITWPQVHACVAGLPLGAVYIVPKGAIAHPGIVGASRSIGLPVGQIADWRFPPGPQCDGLHVHEFPHDWRVHLDRVHPSCSLLNHFFVDVLRV
jgi:hypothetical protein